MNSIQNNTILIDGHSINVLQSERLTSTPFLFLHGKAFDAETWLKLGTLQAVIDKGYSLVALDLPGYGKSPEAAIVPETVIAGVINALHIDSVILVGPSMGGKIAIEFTLNNPDKISGLVLIGAVGVTENQERLNKLPEKSLILWGENDQIADPANATLLHKTIPGSDLIVFQGAKHPCYLEQPELWHKSLLNFATTIVK